MLGAVLARAMRVTVEEQALTPPPRAWCLRSRPSRRAAGPVRAGGERARAAAREGALAGDAGDARAGVCGRDRLRRSGQLRHQRPGRRPVRLSAVVGGAGRERDGDADPVPVGEARDRHRPQPARALPRALPAPGRLGAVGAGGADGDVDRHRRVPRRRARTEPALPRSAAGCRGDDRLHRLRHPRAAAARLPPLRARDHRAARDHLPRLPLRDAQDRPLRLGLATGTASPACAGRGRSTSRSGSSARP